MNTSLLKKPIQACDEALQALQDDLDEACEAAQEKAMRELNFDVLLEALADLPCDVKACALSEASVYKPTHLIADMYAALFAQRTDQTLKQAAEHARQITRWKPLKRRLTLIS